MKSLITACAVLAVAIAAAGCSPGGGAPRKPSIRVACAADIQQFCADVDRSEIRACMTSHADQLSAGCKAAVAARMAARQSAAPPSDAPESSN
jgi:hypothetical protein